MEISIVRAKIRDLISIQKVLHMAHKQNRRRGLFFPASVISRHTLYKRIQRDRYYVLQYHGMIIGTVALKLRKDRAEIGSLTVIPKYRRKGFGGKLLRFAEQKAASKGWNRVSLLTLKKHPTLPLYYRRHGYCRTNAFHSRKSKWILMQKKLN